MKKLMVMACMLFGCAFSTKAATGEKSSKALASARAKHLTDHMIRDLHLNNYQSKKLREINTKVAERITAIEQQYAGNQAKIDELSKEVYAERDRYLESVLSTVQYNDYFGHRKDYTALDKEFAANVEEGAGNDIASQELAGNETVSAR